VRTPAKTVRETSDGERPRRPDRAADLRTLQRELGNRGFAAALGRRTLARDVESEQAAAEASFPQKIKDLAAAALTLTGDQRAAKAISITTQMLEMFVPESLDRLVQWRYAADAKGFELVGARFDKAEGLQVSALHVGDDVLKRLAAGKVDEVASDLRAALQQLNDADIDADRTGIVRIGGERVRVKSRKEADDARRIVAAAKEKFGIGLDSLASRKAARAYYAQKSEPDDHLKATEATPWEYAELVGLERAMQHYAPLLGSGRRHFTFGKLTVAADDKPDDPDDHSAGEYFDAAKTAVLYDELPKSPDKGDADAYERHATHELAHALFGDLVDEFVKHTGGYWARPFARSFKKGAEKPPDGYAGRNAREDLAQSIMYFILDGKWFAGRCPARNDFLQDAIGRRVKRAQPPR
jgi:hypothetical protein